MALSFGVTVLPDPPATRLVELMALAEKQGFEIGWTYDSHVLWQDSFPLLTMAIQATSTMRFGHLVTNPGTREPTVLASLYATLHDISDGRMVMGIGRGDSARRYIGQQPVKVAEFETALRMIKPFMNGQEVHWNEKDLQLKWVREELPEIEMWVAGYGPKALGVAGRVGDGVIIQLAGRLRLPIARTMGPRHAAVHVAAVASTAAHGQLSEQALAARASDRLHAQDACRFGDAERELDALIPDLIKGLGPDHSITLGRPPSRGTSSVRTAASTTRSVSIATRSSVAAAHSPRARARSPSPSCPTSP